MAAITVPFVTIADSAVDPESPVDTGLVTALRDNAEHAMQWLGHSFRGAAVQDHNHDGVNSAKLQIGANSIRNGSFEDGNGSTAGWTLTNFTGGSNAINSANEQDGKYCLAITSTVLANGGAQAETNEFDPITSDALYNFKVGVKASVTGISSKAEIVWYDDAQAQISVAPIFSDTSTATSSAQRGQVVRAPTTARFCKIRLTGGVPAVGTATGTIYFDGVSKSDGPPRIEPGTQIIFTNDADVTTNSTTSVKVKETYCGTDGVATVVADCAADGGSGDAQVFFKINGAAATNRDGTATAEEFVARGGAYTTVTHDLRVKMGDLLQIYIRHGTGGIDSAHVKNFRLKAAIAPFFFVNL